MKKMSETVVFFGSGPVAAKSLELLSKHCDIEAVVTKPKPVHHRGDFPVITTAKLLGLPVHTASNKAELSDIFSKRPFKSRLGILIDFGILVGQDIIDYFPLGIVNSHFSVLPEWRGADPITFAILSGQNVTGVSLMILVEAMDEGPLITYGEQPLSGDETTPELTEQLILLSDNLLQEHLQVYINTRKTSPQSITGRKVSYSRKLTKKDGIIDWNKPAEVIEREIRAFIEWPKSRTTLAGKEVIITKADVTDYSGKPGQVLVQDKQLIAHCGRGSLIIRRLKPAGKNEMTGEAFLAGYSDLLQKS